MKQYIVDAFVKQLFEANPAASVFYTSSYQKT